MAQAATADRVVQSAELGSAPVGADALSLRLRGDWTLHSGVPDLDGIEKEIEAKGTLRRVTFDATGLRDWDSSLLTFILGLVDYANSKKLEIDLTGLPSGVRGLTDLATAVPKQEGVAEKRTRRSLLEIFGDQMISFADGTGRLMEFIGEAAKSFGRLITGRARFRRSDLWLFIEEAGVDALPIVSLLSLLQGLTMAFLGAAQLRMFGAQIYVANLIGMSMVAEVGAVMTAIIMAGRTGAAYAASIGTMQVNEEVDALQDDGLRADGLPGSAANAGAHPDDAAPLPLRQPARHARRRRHRRNRPRPDDRPIRQSAVQRGTAVDGLLRPDQELRVRTAGRDVRLHAGNCLRAERRRRRQRDHVGGCHVDGRHHRRRWNFRRHQPAAGDGGIVVAG